MNQEGDCPIFDVVADVNKASMALHAHCSLAEEFADQFAGDHFAACVANVWKLCVALWGTLPDVNTSPGTVQTPPAYVRVVDPAIRLFSSSNVSSEFYYLFSPLVSLFVRQ